MLDPHDTDVRIQIDTLHSVTLAAEEIGGQGSMLRIDIEAGHTTATWPALTKEEAFEYGRAMYYLAVFLMGWGLDTELAVPLPVAAGDPGPRYDAQFSQN